MNYRYEIKVHDESYEIVKLRGYTFFDEEDYKKKIEELKKLNVKFTLNKASI